MQPQEKVLNYEIQSRLWKVVGVHVFEINTKTLLYIVDYQSKFLIMMKVSCLSADDLVQTTVMICAEYGLQENIVEDAGANFTTETFKHFCR